MKVTKLITSLVVLYLVLMVFPQIMFYIFVTFNIYPAFTYAVLTTYTNISWGLNSIVNVVVYARSSSALKPFLFQLLTCGAKSQPQSAPNLLAQRGVGARMGDELNPTEERHT